MNRLDEIKGKVSVHTGEYFDNDLELLLDVGWLISEVECLQRELAIEKAALTRTETIRRESLSQAYHDLQVCKANIEVTDDLHAWYVNHPAALIGINNELARKVIPEAQERLNAIIGEPDKENILRLQEQRNMMTLLRRERDELRRENERLNGELLKWRDGWS